MAKRVLIIEDDPQVQRLLRSIADAEGWQASYSDSYEKVEAALPWADVLVLDLYLPGIDGIEVLRRLPERHLKLPVVVLTAHEELCDRALELGAYAALTKPFELAELVRVIRSATGDVIDLTAPAIEEAATEKEPGKPASR